MRLGVFGFAMILAGASQARADFLPENDLHLEDNVELSQGVTEEEFNAVIDQAEAVYSPIAAALGGKLKIKRSWNAVTVNASASRFLKTWIVNIYGGLARRPEITRDGFTMVLCHELGHHLAGFPLHLASKWGANEGQSDYHAALACSRLLWKDQAEENAKFRAVVNATAKNLCDERYSASAEQDLCYRQMAAGYSTASLVATLMKTEISFDAHDSEEVTRTSSGHPGAQCRLDTYVAGALCKAQFDYQQIPYKEEASNRVACLTSHGDSMTVRPRCWYAPQLAD